VLGGDVHSGPGQLRVVAGGPIVLESTGRVQTAGGNVNLASGVAISMAKGSVIDAGGGNVGLAAEYGVLLGRVVSPGATLTIDAGQGGIADGVDPADPPDTDGADLEADFAVLRAEGSIGSRAENTPWGTVVVSLDTKIQRLDAVSENGVGIFLVNEGALVIERAEAGRTEAPPGIVDIATRSPLTVAGMVWGSAVNLTAAEGLDGATPDDNLTFREGALVEAVAGAVMLRAGDDLVVEPGATLTSAGGFLLHLDKSNADTVDRCDVNGDGAATPLDVLLVTEDVRRHGARRLYRLTAESIRLDVNRDGQVSPQDVLQIINHLNRQASSQALANWPADADAPAAPRAEGESAPPAAALSGEGIPLILRAPADPDESFASIERCRPRLDLDTLGSGLQANRLHVSDVLEHTPAVHLDDDFEANLDVLAGLPQ
jgi:hypothetical protein